MLKRVKTAAAAAAAGGNGGGGGSNGSGGGGNEGARELTIAIDVARACAIGVRL